MIINNSFKYGLVSKMFHWYMAILLLIILIIGNLSEHLSGNFYNYSILIHNSLGILIFVLVFLRLAWRWSNKIPEKIIINKFLNFLSNFAFFIFYFGMIFAPITGYVLMNIEGKQISFFGYNLPELIDQNKNYEILSHQIHGIVGDLILYTFLLHILAAGYHHWIRKDNSFKRMKFE